MILRKEDRQTDRRTESLVEELCSYTGIFRSFDIIASIENLRARGMMFLDIPDSYYNQLRRRLANSPVKVGFSSDTGWPTLLSKLVLAQVQAGQLTSQGWFQLRRRLANSPVKVGFSSGAGWPTHQSRLVLAQTQAGQLTSQGYF